MRQLRWAAPAACVATPALAHGGGAPGLPIGWTWSPAITVPLAILLALFVTGWLRLNARSGRGASALRRRGLLFAGGWLVLAIALVSPLHEAGERSFAIHMAEHELLMLVAAPLLVLSAPLAIMMWAWPLSARRRLGQVGTTRAVAASWAWLSVPVTATLIQAAALWLWHLPSLFDLALGSAGWHIAQHLSFVLSALIFWTAMLGRHGAATDQGRAVAILCLFATSVVTGALGALMAISASPWYEGYARLGMAPFGLSPAEDQQVAGLLMWVPGGLVHAGAALILMRRLLSGGSGGRTSHAV